MDRLSSLVAPSARKLYSLFVSQDLVGHGALLAEQVRRGGWGELASEIRGHALADEWLDFCHLSLGHLWAKRCGNLYVAANPVTPKFVKVGMTSAAVESRIKSLSNAGVVGAYICSGAWFVHDRFSLERQAHAAMVAQGFSRHKEHFAAPWPRACEVVESVIAAEKAMFEQHGFVLRIDPGDTQ